MEHQKEEKKRVKKYLTDRLVQILCYLLCFATSAFKAQGWCDGVKREEESESNDGREGGAGE